MTFSTVTIDNDETGETEVIRAADEIIIQVLEHATMLSDIYGQDEVVRAMMVTVTVINDMAADVSRGTVN